MVNIRIKVDYERRLEAFLFRQEGSPVELLKELWKIIEEGRFSKKDVKQHGLSFREIVLILRSELGDMLAVPQNPGTKWIVRLVNRAKDLGLDESELRRLAKVLPVKRDGWKWDIEYLIRNATTLLAGDSGQVRGADSEISGPNDRSENIYTGR